MSPEQLAAFIARYPQSAHLDELNYALGVSYLRAKRYAEARAAYARVHTRREDDGGNYGYSSNCVNYGVPSSPHRRCCERLKTANSVVGWHTPPEPKSHPNGLALLKLRLAKAQRIFAAFWAAWADWLSHWLTVALDVATTIAGRTAARARRQLRVQLARHPPLQPDLLETAPPPTPAPWSIAVAVTQSWTEQMRARLSNNFLFRQLRRRIKPLLHDAPLRAALATNALAHTILTVLLCTLIHLVQTGVQ